MSGPNSSVPRITIGPNGPVIPAPADVLEAVLNDLNAAFGGGLNITSPGTPQMQLAQSESAVILDKDNFFAQIISGINPDTADGVMQDAIARIYLLDRIASSPTTVTCTCTGAEGTAIPVGARVQGSSNAIYINTTSAVIPAGGTVDIVFQAVVNGPVEAPVGSITRIYQQIPGWDTVTNSASGIPGRNTETRAEFEFRRKNSVALNGTGTLSAVRANVFNIPGVLDVYTDENDTGTPVTRRGVLLSEHSLYVCVIGGADTSIAQAIITRKGTGCSYNGDTSVVVQDTEGYEPPVPSYTVRFQRPTESRIVFSVNVANTSETPANVEELVRGAIVSSFKGLDGGLRARIGGTIYALRYLSPIEDSGPIQVVSMQVGVHGGSLGDSVSLNGDQFPSLQDSDITVVVA